MRWAIGVASFTLVGLPTPAPAQTPGECLDVADLGSWVRVDSLPQAAQPPWERRDSTSYEIPPRIRLAPRMAGRPENPIQIPDGALQTPHNSRSWRSPAQGDLRLHFSTFYTGLDVDLEQVEGEWSGVARTFSDNIPSVTYERRVRFLTVECGTPPPVPASVERPLPRSVELTSGVVVELGAFLPEGLEVRIERVSPRYRVLGVASGTFEGAEWIGIDTTLQGEVVRSLRVEYPDGADLTAVVANLEARVGSGWRHDDRPDRVSWHNRTTSLVVDLDRGIVTLTDPRISPLPLPPG